MEDPGGRRRVSEWLQSRDVAELFLEKAMDTVDGEVSAAGAEDMEAPGEDEVLVLFGEDTSSLEVHNKSVPHQKVGTEDSFLDVSKSHVQRRRNWSGTM